MRELKDDILPDLPPVEYEALKSSIADHGVEAPIHVDQAQRDYRRQGETTGVRGVGHRMSQHCSAMLSPRPNGSSCGFSSTATVAI